MYGRVKTSRMQEIKTQLTHELKVQSKKRVAERQRINSLFNASPKAVYRAVSSVISVGDVSTVTVPDDIFLSIQRATSALRKIYTELFVKPKNEFMSELSNNCELRYVCDMMYRMVKRRTSAGQLGQSTGKWRSLERQVN